MAKTINLRDLPEELVRRAKACAALHGKTLKDFVMDAISVAVERDIPITAANAGAFLSRPAKKKSGGPMKRTKSPTPSGLGA